MSSLSSVFARHAASDGEDDAYALLEAVASEETEETARCGRQKRQRDHHGEFFGLRHARGDRSV